MAKSRTFDIIFRTKGTDKAQRDIGNVDDRIGDLANNAKQTAKILGTALATATIAVGTKAIKTAGQFEMLRARLVGLTGSQKEANRLFDEFNQIAAKTPFSVQEVIDAGATLQAFGLDAENLLTGIADLAAFMQVDIATAAQNFGRAMNAGAGAADMFRDKGINQLVASFAGVDNVTKLTLPEFQTALQKFIIDPSQPVAGATALMAETLEGKFSNAGDAVDRLAARLGDKFLPAVKNSTDVIINFVNQIDPDNIISYAQSIGIVTAALSAYTVAQNAANISAAAFKKALPVVILSTVVVGIKNVISQFKELKKESESFSQEAVTLEEDLTAFSDRVNKLGFTELVELIDKMGLFSESMTIVDSGSQVTKEHVQILADRYAQLSQSIADSIGNFEKFTIAADTSDIEIFSDDEVEATTNLSNEFGTYADKFTAYSEQLLINLEHEREQERLRQTFIELYPKEAEAMGLINSKMQESVDLSGILGASLQTAFDPDLGAGEAFKGFILQVMSAIQGVILASKAMSEALTFAFTPFGAGVAIAALVSLEAAKALVRNIKFAQFGMDEMVSQPTLIMAGEAGPERVQVTPATRPSVNESKRGMTINFLGPVTDRDFVRDTIIPEIQKTQRLGLA